MVPAGGKVTVPVPALSREPSPAPAAPPAAAPASASAAVSPQPPAENHAENPAPPAAQTDSHGPSLVWPIALGAVGVVGLGVGTILGVNSINNASEANALCPNGVCTEEQGESLMDTARHQAVGANIAFAVGGAGLAAAIIVYLLDGPKKSEQQVDISPWLGQGQAGLELRGRL
jgi:hypothetical protein